MNVSETSYLDNQDDHHFAPRFGVALPAAILSLVLGLSATMSNGLLILTMCRDPLGYFRFHATSYFVFSLALSDLLGGLVFQLLYASFLLSVAAQAGLKVLFDIALVSSHLLTKISIFTVVALSIDRFLAIKLRSRYKNLVTVKKALVCNICIWLSTGLFESIHGVASLPEETFHAIDLHIQTTLPLTTLFCVYLATYVSFRRYTRNTVLVLEAQSAGRTSRLNQRNAALEKKMAITVVLIFVVLFVSHIPHLVVNELEEQLCHGEEHSCSGNSALMVAKGFSFSLLCVSCALNPFFYAFRIPQYSLALKSIFRYFSRRTQLDQSNQLLPLSGTIALPSVASNNNSDINQQRKNTISQR